jgi:putative membrane protein
MRLNKRENMMNRFVASAALGLISIAAFGQQAGDTAGQAAGQAASSTKEAASSTKEAAKSASGQLSKADKKFAKAAMQSDWAELQIGNLALQKSTNDQVKKIAKKIVDDHTLTADALRAMAPNKGLTLPTQTDAKHVVMMSKMSGYSPEEFDKAFLEGQSKDHHMVVEMFQKESSNGNDPDLKAFAAKYLPAIQEHTQMIDQAKGSSTPAAAQSK